MKTAQLHISCLEFTCPKCDEYIANDKDGSHLFPVVGFFSVFPTMLECECGEKLKVPVSRIRKMCSALHQSIVFDSP